LCIFAICFLVKSKKNIPKLIVEINIDGGSQTFYDGLWDRMFNLKKLAKFGIMNVKNTAMTPNTAPSHAILSCGATSAYNGIIANSIRNEDGDIVNAYSLPGTCYALNIGEDETYKREILTRGAPDHSANTNLKAETLSDIIIRSGGKSRTVATKNRGAIPFGGHPRTDAFGNKKGAVTYWLNLNDQECNMVTSDYFLAVLPAYVTNYNNNGFCQSLVSKTWTPIVPIETLKYYDMNREGSQIHTKCPEVTPGTIWPKRYASKPSSLLSGPGGDELAVDFAIVVFDEEELGHGQRHQDNDITDHLVVGLPSLDGCLHYGGIQSMECEDIALRTDVAIGNFMDHVLTKVDSRDILWKVSADHGGGNPVAMNVMDGYSYSTDAGISGSWMGGMNAELATVFDFVDTGVSVIKKVDPAMIWFDRVLFTFEQQDDLQTYVAETLRMKTGISLVYTNNYMEMHRTDPIIKDIYTPTGPDVYYMVTDKGYPYTSDYLYARVVAGHSESSTNEDWTLSIIAMEGIEQKVNYGKTRQTQSVPSICAVAGMQVPSGAYDEIYPGLQYAIDKIDPYGIKN